MWLSLVSEGRERLEFRHATLLALALCESSYTFYPGIISTASPPFGMLSSCGHSIRYCFFLATGNEKLRWASEHLGGK